jgi:hypothetical protein
LLFLVIFAMLENTGQGLVSCLQGAWGMHYVTLKCSNRIVYLVPMILGDMSVAWNISHSKFETLS